ncbi:MAG: hypothetical protein ACT6FF_06950 [Methanosarcinaceae archaeon]
MNAFWIGTLVFILIVLLTVFYLKSASILVSDNKLNYTIEIKEDVNYAMDGVPGNLIDDENYSTASDTVSNLIFKDN